MGLLATPAACQRGGDAARFDQALAAYDRGDHASAMRSFEPLAAAGDPAAQFYVARMLERGYGVAANPAAAAPWYADSARGGVSTAAMNLGLMFAQGRGVQADATIATDLLLRAAAFGEPGAALDVGRAYATGEGRDRDLVEAFAWYRIARDEGAELAQEELDRIRPEMDASAIAAGARRHSVLRERIDERSFDPRELPSIPELRHRSRETPAAGRDGAVTVKSTGAPRTVSRAQDAQPAPSRSATSASKHAAPVRFGVHRVRDAEIGGDAFTILVPEGWSFEGGVMWMHERANLAAASFRVSDPTSGTALVVYPQVLFTWSDQGLAFMGPGQNYMGLEIQAPVRSPADYVQHFVLPRVRQDLAGARIVGEEALPALAACTRELNPDGDGMTHRVIAGRVRVEFAANGRTMHEDFYVSLLYTVSAMLPGSTLWRADRCYSFRAERGRLEDQQGLLHSVLHSVRVQPDWAAGYLHVVDLFRQRQYASIRAAGELSATISRNSEEIRRMYSESWRQRQESLDRVARGYGESIRDVQTFDDPFLGRAVELPAGYVDVWAAESGGYVLSSEHGYDPNVGSTVRWQRLSVAR